MATAIKAVDSIGRVVGRCDARCHHATTKKCVCLCGGRFHGRGEDVLAVDMSREDLDYELHEFAARNEYDLDKLVVKVAPSVQLRLFPVGPRQHAQAQVAA